MKTYSPYRLAVPEPRALGLAIALAFCAAPAAAQVDSSVYVSSFEYTISAPGSALADLMWADPFQSLNATSLDGGGLLGSNIKSSETSSYIPTTAFADTAHAFTTYATPGNQTFFLTAFTSQSVGPLGTPRNQSTASGLNAGTFSIFDLDSGAAIAGTVTFTIDYILAANKLNGNAVSDFSTAFLHFNAMSENGLSGDDLSTQIMSFSQGAKSGQFKISVSLGADQVGFYTLDGNAESFAVASVPEPHEWALMLAGFLGLGAYARKRKAAHA